MLKPGDIVKSIHNSFGVKYVVVKVIKNISETTYNIQTLPECGNEYFNEWIVQTYCEVEESDLIKVGTYREDS